MTFGGRIERLFDAPAELVFETLVGPEFQEELYAGLVKDLRLERFEIDLRVGGTWTIVLGPPAGRGEPDRITSVFREVDPPNRLVHDVAMYASEWGRTVSFVETITLEERHGKTLVAIELGGLENEADRDAFMSGTPSFVDALERVVALRVAREGERGSMQ